MVQPRSLPQDGCSRSLLADLPDALLVHTLSLVPQDER